MNSLDHTRSCGAEEGAVLAYVEDALDEQAAAKVLAHAKKCASCREDLALVNEIHCLLRRAAEASAPTDEELYAAMQTAEPAAIPLVMPDSWKKRLREELNASPMDLKESAQPAPAKPTWLARLTAPFTKSTFRIPALAAGSLAAALLLITTWPFMKAAMISHHEDAPKPAAPAGGIGPEAERSPGFEGTEEHKGAAPARAYAPLLDAPSEFESHARRVDKPEDSRKAAKEPSDSRESQPPSSAAKTKTRPIERPSVIVREHHRSTPEKTSVHERRTPLPRTGAAPTTDARTSQGDRAARTLSGSGTGGAPPKDESSTRPPETVVSKRRSGRAQDLASPEGAAVDASKQLSEAGHATRHPVTDALVPHVRVILRIVDGRGQPAPPFLTTPRILDRGHYRFFSADDPAGQVSLPGHSGPNDEVDPKGSRKEATLLITVEITRQDKGLRLKARMEDPISGAVHTREALDVAPDDIENEIRELILSLLPPAE